MFNFLDKKFWLPVVTLMILGSLIYSFNLNNQLFWDDDDWIVNNSSVHSLSWDNIKFWFSHDVLAGIGLKSNYYRPFLFFTFALNYIISGVKPLPYHLLSNAVHIINGILVFGFLYLVFRRRLLAFLTALFFLIHPLQTEAVTYISGRGDVLVTMFILLGLLFFYKSQKLTTPDVAIRHRESAIGYWSRFYRGSSIASLSGLLAIGTLILALLSRETAIIFPILALAFYASVISRDRFPASLRIGLIKTWPYFAVVLVYGILRLTALNFIDTLNFYSEQNIYSENLYVRIFTFFPILWEYLKILIVPVGLHMERSAVVYTSLFQWPVWSVFSAILGLMFVVLRFYYLEFKNSFKIENLKFKIQQPNSNFNIWLLGVSWFFIALGPVSGITPINALIYEHWLYLPMIGFWLIVSYYLVKLLNYLKFNKNAIGYWLLAIGLMGYFSFFSYQSIQRNILWGDPVKFYENILKYEPESVRITNNLGNIYFNQNDKEKAEFYYRKAAESGNAFAQPHFNIGSILQSRGDIGGAIKEYERAIKIDPNFYYAYQNLAVIYAQEGDFVKAVTNIEKLKLVLPNNPRIYYNSALVYIALNNREKAVADLKEGLKYASRDPETGKLIEELIQRLAAD